MRTRALLFGVVAVGLTVFSCGGEEFGNDDGGESEAGSSAVADGGGDVASGGSAIKPPKGGSSGSVSAGGTAGDVAGMPGVLGGGGNVGGDGGQDCSDVVAPELPGDCRKLVCSMGKLTSQPDSNDKPEARGVCDVPQCEDGQPAFDSDPSKCAINEECDQGLCACAGCPNGKVPALSSTLCRLPAATVTANKTNTGSAASRVADGSGETTWNSGALNGVLTIVPAAPQPMQAVALWLTGLADNTWSSDKKYILVQVSIETDSGPPISKSGNFSFAQMATGPLRLEFGLVNVKKLTFTFESPSTWISVNEVVFEACSP